MNAAKHAITTVQSGVGRSAKMKVGDIVKYGYAKSPYGYDRDDKDSPAYGTILCVNEAGGTLKVLDQQGKIDWFVTSYCEVISESR